jgi:hypothetical protein
VLDELDQELELCRACSVAWRYPLARAFTADAAGAALKFVAELGVLASVGVVLLLGCFFSIGATSGGPQGRVASATPRPPEPGHVFDLSHRPLRGIIAHLAPRLEKLSASP